MSLPRQAWSPVLLYDDSCGFCANSVQFLLRHDRRRTLLFAALDSDYGRAVLGRHPELRTVDSVVFVEPARVAKPERVFMRSAAALQVASYLGGLWHLFQLARLVPGPLRDLAYGAIARHRHRLPATRCVNPSERDRARFLG